MHERISMTAVEKPPQSIRSVDLAIAPLRNQIGKLVNMVPIITTTATIGLIIAIVAAVVGIFVFASFTSHVAKLLGVVVDLVTLGLGMHLLHVQNILAKALANGRTLFDGSHVGVDDRLDGSRKRGVGPLTPIFTVTDSLCRNQL
jgi:hypothetical protein